MSDLYSASRWTTPIYWVQLWFMKVFFDRNATEWFNLGLQFKFRKRWRETLYCNLRAHRIDRTDQPYWWNASIAAAALARWRTVRITCRREGVKMDLNAQEPTDSYGTVPVRLQNGEVVWGTRLDLARVRIENVPLPDSPSAWGDTVLIDGVPDGERKSGDQIYSVFNVIQTLRKSGAEVQVFRFNGAEEELIKRLGFSALDNGWGFENWTSSVRMLCAECSRGLPCYDEHPVNGQGLDFQEIAIATVAASEQVTQLVEEWARKNSVEILRDGCV